MKLVTDGCFAPVTAAWSWEAPPAGRRLPLDDRFAARAWLRRAAATAGGMAPLRRLLAERAVVPAYGLDDGEVIDLLAGWIASGELRLATLEWAALSSWGDAGDEAPAPAPSVPRPAPVDEPEAPAEERTFGDDLDAEAIAAIMREAARTGVPFCEECTRKKLRAGREARP
jgi:hypothetical protein